MCGYLGGWNRCPTPGSYSREKGVCGYLEGGILSHTWLASKAGREKGSVQVLGGRNHCPILVASKVDREKGVCRYLGWGGGEQGRSNEGRCHILHTW